MKLAILNMTGGGMCGGFKRYLYEMIPRLARSNKIESIMCAAPTSLNIQQWLPQSKKVFNCACKPMNIMKCMPDRSLHFNLKNYQPDVIFVPTERLFSFDKVPVVNMAFNLLPLVERVEGIPVRERPRMWYQRYNAQKAFRGATKIIAVSKYVKDLLSSKYNVNDSKISVVHFGSECAGMETQHKPKMFLSEDLHGGFLFTAGSMEVYRGLEDIIRAMSQLDGDVQNIRLVIAGKARKGMHKYQDRMIELCKTNKLEAKIIWAGALNEHEMAWCYSNCIAFIMTSRVESFGMVNVEAMAKGCCCVTADNSCLPEIFGDAALYYTPKNPQSLAMAIRRILNFSNYERSQMSNNAVIRSSEFRWDDAADRTVKIFQECVAK